ncbi:MAG: DEAD/DEAH box helicase family protein [Verrucomicrobia bacterium]|nr:DEAD/DEAH box helicase family protein [Verrucomicrobiota bacterium]
MMNESETCRQLIEPALQAAGWSWDRHLRLGPGRVNISGGSMYDSNQELVLDHLLRFGQIPLAVLEAKGEAEPAADGIQQGQRYAERLGLRFTIASNGREYILVDRQAGEHTTSPTPPTPGDILQRLGYTIDWARWQSAFSSPWHIDQITRKEVRPFQEMAIFETMLRFARGITRVLLLMATGTGKTFTVFQLIWKLIQGNVLRNNRILFLTDRNNLQDQAYRAFSAFPSASRLVIDKDLVAQGKHRVGQIYFANYQNLDEELDGKKIFEHFEPDFFDLIVVDECHRSGFGDWFGMLEYFAQAFQLGLTATPREIAEVDGRELTPEEGRRDTYTYFGDPAYTYTLKQAIEDGYLVPYLLEQRITNLDADGFTGSDGRQYTTANFEREIRLPDRTKFIAEDLHAQLGQHGLLNEKVIVFCVDDTHAAFFAQELRRISGDNDYAARITRSERNSHQLERNFQEVGRAKPRVAVTVDLLSTGFDAPDVKVIVFARPIKSSILYKQMKGRGTRLCEDIDKRFFSIFDYSGASALEDAEFDGHPANIQKPAPSKKSPPKPPSVIQKPVAQGVSLYIAASERFVCLADGRKIPFDEYCEQSKQVIRKISPNDLQSLLDLWADKQTRSDVREELKSNDIHIAAFRHYFELDAADDVDILGKVGFTLPSIPMRHDRVTRFWDRNDGWLRSIVGTSDEELKMGFWETALDHYALYSIDDLERGETYSAPQFAQRFGSFARFLPVYGGGQKLRGDLEQVKHHLYVAH